MPETGATISPEDVERVALAIFHTDPLNLGRMWEKVLASERDTCRAQARAAITMWANIGREIKESGETLNSDRPNASGRDIGREVPRGDRA